MYLCTWYMCIGCPPVRVWFLVKHWCPLERKKIFSVSFFRPEKSKLVENIRSFNAIIKLAHAQIYLHIIYIYIYILHIWPSLYLFYLFIFFMYLFISLLCCSRPFSRALSFRDCYFKWLHSSMYAYVHIYMYIGLCMCVYTGLYIHK